MHELSLNSPNCRASGLTSYVKGGRGEGEAEGGEEWGGGGGGGGKNKRKIERG